jgi:hypothetical protein
LLRHEDRRGSSVWPTTPPIASPAPLPTKIIAISPLLALGDTGGLRGSRDD